MNRRKEILDRRTAALAAEERIARQQEGTEYVVLDTGTFRFGIPVEATETVVPFTTVVPLPDTPPAILGVVPHSGKLLSVLDLGLFWGIGPCSAPAFFVVARMGERDIALLAREVVGVSMFEDDSLSTEMLRDAAGRGQGVRGVTDGLVTLLDLRELLEQPKLSVGRALSGRVDRNGESHD